MARLFCRSYEGVRCLIGEVPLYLSLIGGTGCLSCHDMQRLREMGSSGSPLSMHCWVLARTFQSSQLPLTARALKEYP